MTPLAEHFLALHAGPPILLMPNPWDAGSAVLLASLGFSALATTSSGSAATHARLDGDLTRDEAIAHGGALAAAVAGMAVPVSADLENGFAADAAGVAETVRLAAEAGLAGCSIEDYSRETGTYAQGEAVERVAAAVEAANAGGIVLTARCENLIRNQPELPAVIARLQAYQEAGAHVLFAPGLRTAEDIGTVVRNIDRPLNVLAGGGAPGVAELEALGVSRVSVGGGFAWVAYNAAIEAAKELREQGTYGYLPQVAAGSAAAKAAFTPKR